MILFSNLIFCRWHFQFSENCFFDHWFQVSKNLSKNEKLFFSLVSGIFIVFQNSLQFNKFVVLIKSPNSKSKIPKWYFFLFSFFVAGNFNFLKTVFFGHWFQVSENLSRNLKLNFFSGLRNFHRFSIQFPIQ
jgi:hypothetical protein